MSVPTAVRALFAACCFLVPALCQDDARAIAAFNKSFAPPPKNKATIDDKKAALAALAGIDNAPAAEALVDGWNDVGVELQQVDLQRDAANEELAKLVKGQESAEKRMLPPDALKRFNELKDEVPKLRQRADALRELQEKVAARVAELRRRDAALWLLNRVCTNKQRPMRLRLAAAKSVGSSAVDVMPELGAAIARSRDPEEQVVLLEAAVSAGKAARLHSTPIIALLQSKDDAVAERAAMALATIAVPEAIAPVIDLLARSEGQTQARVAGALEVLSGQQFGTNVGSWKAWWAAEGAAVAAGGKALGTGKPSKRSNDGKAYYFGIPQEQSSSILYVIDCSGSMTAKVEMPNGDGGKRETSRMEATKDELVRALERLRSTQKFGILWYNDLPHFWEPKLQLATKESIARAQGFVKTLAPAQSTNIHDTLEQAFTLVGRGSKDKHYGIEFDTIFLLTDGSPTTADGKADSTDKILLGVRAWNALKRVTIHTIAIGKDLNASFLQQLASENGGEFKQY